MSADGNAKRSVHDYLLLKLISPIRLKSKCPGFILRNKLSPCQTKAIPVRTVEQDKTLKFPDRL
jgi:hypothetical protein